MTQEHECCNRLASLAQDVRVPFQYDPTFREWSLILIKPDTKSESDWMPNESVAQDIEFCPFCATDMPKPLRRQWFDTLEVMGFDDPRQDDIPEEFRSDRWWKERGL